MKKIVLQFKDFIADDFEWKSYLWTLLFVASAITINYTFNFERGVLIHHPDKGVVILRFFLYYMVAWFAVAIPKLIIRKQQKIFASPQFWIKILLFFGLISFTSGFRFNAQWFSFIDDSLTRAYVVKLTTQIKCLLAYSLPLIVMGLIFDRQQPGIYGVNRKFGNGTLYLKMLLYLSRLLSEHNNTQTLLYHTSLYLKN